MIESAISPTMLEAAQASPSRLLAFAELNFKLAGYEFTQVWAPAYITSKPI